MEAKGKIGIALAIIIPYMIFFILNIFTYFERKKKIDDLMKFVDGLRRDYRE